MRSRPSFWVVLIVALVASLGALVALPRLSARRQAREKLASASSPKPSIEKTAAPASTGREAARPDASAPAAAVKKPAAPSAAKPATARQPEQARPDLSAILKTVVVCEDSDREKRRPRRGRPDLEETSRGGGSEGGQDRYAAWFYKQRAYPAKHIPKGALRDALQHARVVNGGLHGGPGDPATIATPPQQTWVPLGPGTIPNGQTDDTTGTTLSPVSGRVSAIAVHPTNPNIVYAAGAQGGVWKSSNALSLVPTWTPLTDHQPSLAVGAIAIDTVDPNIIYVGTGEANGSCDSYYGQGILRSNDGGTTWIQLGGAASGPFAGQSISKILIDPGTAGSTTGTTVWASTALGFLASGTEACDIGQGVWNGAVWRSNDSGTTWSLQNVPTGAAQPNARIHDMALDPTDSNILYVAVRPVPTAANGGIWKSVNALAPSATFTKLAGGFPNTATAFPGIRRITLGIGPGGAPGTLYAALENVNTSGLWGFFRTTNGGTTWSHVQAASGNVSWTGFNVTATSGAFVTGSSWVGRRIILEVGSTQSATIASVTDSTHLVLSDITTTGPTLTGTWSVASYPNYCEGQCFYDMTIGVDPGDATGETVYVGGNPNGYSDDLSGVPGSHYNWRSDDGGGTWTSISQGNGTGGLHTDDHAIAFDTSVSPSRVYDGNDGGVWRSEDQGDSWTSMNSNLAITQFQGVSTHPTNTGIVIGGTQDNGTNILGVIETPPAWFHTDFGDGGQSLMDQGDPDRMLHTYYNFAFGFMGPAKTIDGGVNGPGGTYSGGSWDFVGTYYGYGTAYYNGMDPTDDVSFYAPMAQHPFYTPNVIYFGSDKLYRSPDPQIPGLGDSWTAKSPVLTAAGPASGQYLSAIGVLPTLVAGKEVIYTGASDGRISVSATVDGTGAVPTWAAIDAAPLPGRFVTDIEVDAADATGNTAIATFSGFNANTPTTPGHVFRTANGLAGTPTWTNISGDLPDVPTNAIAVEPGRIYVGTDIGMFRTLDGGVHWRYLSEGFPVVSVFGLERNPSTGQIVASTHGRGMFQLNAADVTSPVCGGSITGPNQFEGAATDGASGDTGISQVVLASGSTNLVISSITYLDPTSVTYVVNTIDPLLPGSGTVVVSDYNGNTCQTAVSLAGGPNASKFFTLTPCRLSDTRLVADGPAIAAGSDRTFIVTGGSCGVPSTASSISVNVTVAAPTAAGGLQVFAGGTTSPGIDTIDYRAGQTRANNAIIRLGAGGTITVHSDQPTGTVQFILDVNGYFE